MEFHKGALWPRMTILLVSFAHKIVVLTNHNLKLESLQAGAILYRDPMINRTAYSYILAVFS